MLKNVNNTSDEKMSPVLKQAVASLALEGIKLSSESIEDLKLVEAGHLTEQELLNRLLLRAK